MIKKLINKKIYKMFKKCIKIIEDNGADVTNFYLEGSRFGVSFKIKGQLYQKNLTCNLLTDKSLDIRLSHIIKSINEKDVEEILKKVIDKQCITITYAPDSKTGDYNEVKYKI